MRFIEEALRQQLGKAGNGTVNKIASRSSTTGREIAERNRLTEALIRRTARFQLGRKPTREEMNVR